MALADMTLDQLLALSRWHAAEIEKALDQARGVGLAEATARDLSRVAARVDAGLAAPEGLDDPQYAPPSVAAGTVAPSLVESIEALFAEFGPAGVARCVAELRATHAPVDVPANSMLVGLSGPGMGSVSWVGPFGIERVGMSAADAIPFAAWVAVVADPAGDEFDAALGAVRSC